MGSVRLIMPDIKYRKSFLEAMDDFENAKIDEWFWPHANSSRETLQPYLQIMKENHLGINIPKTFVSSSMFWLLEGTEVIGRVHIRHKLNEKLLQKGGHIGYYIKPSRWNQGYGTQALKLGLKKMPEWDIQKVLVTADDKNTASWKIIEKCGGVLENKIVDGESNLIRRYWIKL